MNTNANSKIRSACDACHKMKVRCSGDVPCETCLNTGDLCIYSYSGRLGRPKGTRNSKGKTNDGRSSRRSQSSSEKDDQPNTAERLSPPLSARSIHQESTARQVQAISQSQVFPITEEDVATNAVAPIDSPEYCEMLEIDTFAAAGYGESQRPPGHAVHGLDFSHLLFSDGHDPSFLEQATEVKSTPPSAQVVYMHFCVEAVYSLRRRRIFG